MKEKTIRLRRKKGPYRSDIRKFSIEGIEIDNYFEVKVYEKEKLVDTIIEKRKLPEKVKPPHVVPPPTADAKLLLIDHKDEFWVLDSKIKRDITVWIVPEEDGKTKIVDAVTGETVGHGTPPPTNRSISVSGYHEGYHDPWRDYRGNATSYFNRWGYSTWNAYAPAKSSMGARIRNYDYKMYFCIAHGDGNQCKLSSREWMYSSEVRSYMSGRHPFQFSFLGQCGAFTGRKRNSMYYALMKGRTTGTCAIGYYNAHLSAGWRYSLSWQKKLFKTVDDGHSWYIAFQRANATYPACREMVRFVGDTTLGKEHKEEEEDKDEVEQGRGRGRKGSGAGPRGRGGGSGGSDGRGRGSGGAGPRGR